MKLRYFALIAVLAVTAAVALSAQQGTVHEKLYVSLETTDDVAVVDLATFKQIKTLKVGSHPHGQASPRSQDRLLRGGRGWWHHVTLIDTIRDEVIKTFHVGFGTEPQNGAITPDGRFLYQPSYAGYWQVFDTQKEEIIEYIRTLGIGHNTVMDPTDGSCTCSRLPGAPGPLEAAVTRTAEDTTQGSDRRRRKNAQSRRNHPIGSGRGQAPSARMARRFT